MTIDEAIKQLSFHKLKGAAVIKEANIIFTSFIKLIKTQDSVNIQILSIGSSK